MVYWPWRNEDDDLEGKHNNFQAHYDEVKDVVQLNEQRCTHYADLIDETLADLEDVGFPIHAWDMLLLAVNNGSDINMAKSKQKTWLTILNDHRQNIDGNAELHARSLLKQVRYN